MATSESARVELLPLEGSVSPVWKYFGFPAENGKFLESDKKKRERVHCKLCHRVFSYVHNTTNLWQHLQESHRVEYVEAKSGTTHTVSAKAKGQSTIVDALHACQPLAHTSHRWKSLTESVCYFIAKDMQPFQTVNDAGFRQLLKALEPRYEYPDRKTISTIYMPRLYAREKERIGRAMANVNSFALTTDIWTSRSNQAYTGLTVHYVDQEFNLQSHLLETKEFPESHTGANIAEELETIMDEWKLHKQGLSAITTDNGSNVVSAINMLECMRMPCFSHTLQLAVERVLKLPRVSTALARCRRLVSHFNHSAKSTYMLKQKQTNLQCKQLGLVQDVVTRWNSAYYMAERVLSQQQPLCAALLELRKGDLMPSDGEFTTLESFVKVMQPLVQITEAIGAEKWVTISAVRPLLHKLLSGVFLVGEQDTQLERSMKVTMYTDLVTRYTSELQMMLNIASFLDPRFRALLFLPEEEKLAVISKVEKEAVELASECADQSGGESQNKEGADEPPQKRSRGEKHLMALISDVIHPPNQCQSPTEKALTEARRYIDEEPADEDPLLWWSKNSPRYPNLTVLAKKYLAIPATSVPAERAFSTAGNIVNQKRACLLPENVNLLVFLAENLD